MDSLTIHRKARLQALIDSPPFNGSQIDFAKAIGKTKGRVSQMLDHGQPFGEGAARAVCEALGKPARYFEHGYGEDQKPIREAPTLGGAVIALPHLNKDEAGMFERYLNGELEPTRSPEVWAMPSYFEDIPVFAVTVEDDMMEPLIPKGAHVIIGVGIPHQSGDKVFVRESGLWFIRRLLVDGNTLYTDTPRTQAKPLTGELVGPVVSVNLPTMNLEERMRK